MTSGEPQSGEAGSVRRVLRRLWWILREILPRAQPDGPAPCTIRAVVGLWAMFLFTGTASAADGQLATCINRKVAFDGFRLLHYASVTDNGSASGVLYDQYPGDCSAAAAHSCTATEIPVGDPVAIGKVCGPWAYVQHIGETTVLTGWMQRTALMGLKRKLPFNAGEPGGRPKLAFSSRYYPSRAGVRLVRGAGLPVCEAYLQRFNQTIFHEPPPCGRPDNDQVPGFGRLNRLALSAAVVTALYPRVFNLSHFTSATDKAVPAPPGTLRYSVVLAWPGHILPIAPVLHDGDPLSVWGFDHPLDIENDGHPRNVVIWRDFPPLWIPDDPQANCGVSKTNGDIAGIEQVPLLFTKDFSGIDEAATASVFGDPTPPPIPPEYAAAARDPKSGFPLQRLRPIGDSIEIFEYRGQYYFDTTKNTARLDEQNQVFVYQRKMGKTRQVCELQNIEKRWEPL